MNMFLQKVKALKEYIHQLPKAEDFKEVLLPVEKGLREEKNRLKNGMPIPGYILEKLLSISRDLKVSFPESN